MQIYTLIFLMMKLKQELRTAKTNAEIVKSTESNEMTNVDVMRRLSNLEKMVYGTKKDLDSNNEND